eukprot:TRINITY_DN793_c0_g1_i5.p1 TRINITY_DN793_c0_g1~~TRINITY_DN793_c0_g1_i5.p1  ORF type:complete len:193 (+),score=8.87 TRINITY_DN793_c0_g1_i5:121-699(+)
MYKPISLHKTIASLTFFIIFLSYIEYTTSKEALTLEARLSPQLMRPGKPAIIHLQIINIYSYQKWFSSVIVQVSLNKNVKYISTSPSMSTCTHIISNHSVACILDITKEITSLDIELLVSQYVTKDADMSFSADLIYNDEDCQMIVSNEDMIFEYLVGFSSLGIILVVALVIQTKKSKQKRNKKINLIKKIK